MSTNEQAIAAWAYAQGRIDAGEPAFMDTDDFTTNVTTGAFAHQYATAVTEGHELVLITAWSVFQESAGRTVVHIPTEDPEDEMATAQEVETMRAVLDSGLCLNSRTFMGGGTYRCTLRNGHSPNADHSYNFDGKVITWKDEESDQAVAKRIRFVPASRYSTEVTRTAYPVSTDAQVAEDLARVQQEALSD